MVADRHCLVSLGRTRIANSSQTGRETDGVQTRGHGGFEVVLAKSIWLGVNLYVFEGAKGTE